MMFGSWDFCEAHSRSSLLYLYYSYRGDRVTLHLALIAKADPGKTRPTHAESSASAGRPSSARLSTHTRRNLSDRSRYFSVTSTGGNMRISCLPFHLARLPRIHGPRPRHYLSQLLERIRIYGDMLARCYSMSGPIIFSEPIVLGCLHSSSGLHVYLRPSSGWSGSQYCSVRNYLTHSVTKIVGQTTHELRFYLALHVTIYSFVWVNNGLS